MSGTTARPSSELVPRPQAGRVFEEARRVRLADVSPGGRLRLDAATRYLQDLSADDTDDAALPDAEAWVVRRTVIEVQVFPRYLEALELATWCSGTGSRWAERRISVVGQAGGRMDAATTWVHVDLGTGRPRRVPEGFAAIYGEAAGGRTVTARLEHPDPPPGAESVPWALRFTDFDVLSHVNNAAYWEAVEEALSARRELRAPMRAEVEHRTAIERGAEVELVVADEPDGLAAWLLADGEVAASARVQRL
ncbi:MAG: acyl-[acyl-carrier-protein] thioesterase [Acidimicrobiales bacterium]